jgi:hypothetical protein
MEGQWKPWELRMEPKRPLGRLDRQCYPTLGRLQDYFFKAPSSLSLPSLLQQTREGRGHVGVPDIPLVFALHDF